MDDAVLDALRGAGYPLTVAELATMVDSGAAAVQDAVLRTVAELELEGLVTRSTPPQERATVALS